MLTLSVMRRFRVLGRSFVKLRGAPIIVELLCTVRYSTVNRVLAPKIKFSAVPNLRLGRQSESASLMLNGHGIPYSVQPQRSRLILCF